MDRNGVISAVSALISALGEDASREGLAETPERAARMYEELMGGYGQDPNVHIKTFLSSGEQTVTISDIPFYSMCEHHLLPFFGTVDIEYHPRNGRVLGLSKFSRIINVYAKRLQLQERMTREIAEFLYSALDPHSLTVTVRAEHMCMTVRGARAAGAKTTTRTVLGEE